MRSRAISSQTSVPTTQPPGEGWRLFCGGAKLSPFDYTEVELWRRGWRSVTVASAYTLPPMFNVANLWWRPAGLLMTRAAKLKAAGWIEK